MAEGPAQIMLEEPTLIEKGEREIHLKELRETAKKNLDLVKNQRLSLITITSVITFLTGIAFILLYIHIKASKGSPLIPEIVGKSITGAGVLTALLTGLKGLFNMSSKKKDNSNIISPVFLPEIDNAIVERSLRSETTNDELKQVKKVIENRNKNLRNMNRFHLGWNIVMCSLIILSIFGGFIVPNSLIGWGIELIIIGLLGLMYVVIISSFLSLSVTNTAEFSEASKFFVRILILFLLPSGIKVIKDKNKYKNKCLKNIPFIKKKYLPCTFEDDLVVLHVTITGHEKEYIRNLLFGVNHECSFCK
ncbi:hypothetical protein RhiirA4_479305 [Rhizophagus irregularis]|uniref:Uncharacterized protein n=1 Tax=Rhizophagus irregularis TaxID=588596 RepID=A0A2I1HG75_9GLOM|nr:hypothetical protein RhiirA4_479305 [Rhizophagus irregularis]